MYIQIQFLYVCVFSDYYIINMYNYNNNIIDIQVFVVCKNDNEQLFSLLVLYLLLLFETRH